MSFKLQWNNFKTIQKQKKVLKRLTGCCVAFKLQHWSFVVVNFGCADAHLCSPKCFDLEICRTYWNNEINSIKNNRYFVIPGSKWPRSFETTFVMPFRWAGVEIWRFGISQLQRRCGANSGSNYVKGKNKIIFIKFLKGINKRIKQLEIQIFSYFS